MVSGLWELDHCQFSRALEHLTDPSLTPTYADDILLILLQHPKCDKSLAMAYYITVRPPLRSEQVLDNFFALVVKTNVIEAYNFAKQNPSHRRLLEKLVVSIHEEEASEARAERALQLIGLPFTAEEEAWFEDCLLHGAAAKLPGAKDSVLMRRLAMGSTQSGPASITRLKGSKIDGVNWDDIRKISAG
jgi:Nuclear pore complex assembly